MMLLLSTEQVLHLQSSAIQCKQDLLNTHQLFRGWNNYALKNRYIDWNFHLQDYRSRIYYRKACGFYCFDCNAYN